MATRRAARIRSAGQTTETSNETIFSEDPLEPATTVDKRKWKGFCEIESEPAFFNCMLRRFGVQGVRVQEVISLEDEILMSLPRPIYGLIFLFRWVEDDSERQEQSCPKEVWFANQTANNSCASVALLNIVNNIPDVDLGEHLRSFKNFTESFSPALRGDAISNFSFVKDIHNSFARKIDMLNIDLLLKNEASSKRGAKKRKLNIDDAESGFHFIAFVPVEGDLWKLDGLERQPMRIGAVDDHWIDLARPEIMARMAEAGDNEFAVLALVRDPLHSFRCDLACNIKSLIAISNRMATVKCAEDTPGVHSNGSLDRKEVSRVLQGPDKSYGLTQELLHKVELPENIKTLLSSDSVIDLMMERTHLLSAQHDLRLAVEAEEREVDREEEQAELRCRDIGGKMRKFAQKVSEMSQN